MIRIEVLNGLEQGRVIELAPGTWVLGRRDGIDVKVIGDAVSGRHIEVEVSAGGETHFKDLASTNGTWSGGLKVEEGEWFAGTELRIGNLSLRLLAADEAPGAASAADHGDGADGDAAEIHSRAVEEAMSGGGRGGPMMLVLLVALVGAAAAWYFIGATPGFDDAEPSAGAGAGATAVNFDAIDNYGHFDAESAESWQLSNGLQVSGDSLVSSGGSQRAKLLPSFGRAVCALEISAKISGDLQVWPLIEWGKGESESLGRWAGAQLGKASTSLQLPCDDAEWFRLSLRTAGSGSLSDLQVEVGAGDGASKQSADNGRRFISAGGNLILFGLDGQLVSVTGAGGQWKQVSSGIEFVSDADHTWLDFDFGNQLVLVLTAGDPVPASKGVVVEHAGGLVIRGSRPTMIDFAFDQPISISSTGILRLEPKVGISIDWDLRVALTAAAQLNLDIKRHARQQNTAALLASVKELVQRYPLDDDEIEWAEQLRADAISAGRTKLNQLERLVAESMFLGAASEMQRVGADAAILAQSLPGTDVAIEAGAISDLLAAESERVLAASRQSAAEYRRRLLGALELSYPVMASWIAGEQL